MAHFQLAPGETSRAVTHRTVEEVWYFLGGHGEMWRLSGEDEQVDEVSEGVSIDIPVGTHFQFRALGDEPLRAVGVTMPPWPGDDEALFVAGPWDQREETVHEPPALRAVTLQTTLARPRRVKWRLVAPLISRIGWGSSCVSGKEKRGTPHW